MSQQLILTIPIKDEQQLWLLEKSIPVFDCLEFFPKTSVKKADGSGWVEPLVPITFETDVGWSFSTVIEYGKFIISERSQSRPGTTLYLKESGAKPGDKIQLYKLETHRFLLCLQRT